MNQPPPGQQDAALLLALQADRDSHLITDARSEGSHADLLLSTTTGWRYAWDWMENGPRDGDAIHRFRLICEGLGFDSVSYWMPKGGKAGWRNGAHFLHWPAEGPVVLGPSRAACSP